MNGLMLRVHRCCLTATAGSNLNLSGFRKRDRRNGVASDFFPFFSVFFRFLPFSSVFFSFFLVSFPFSSVFPVFFSFFQFNSFSKKKNRGDTVRETPFAKPRTSWVLGRVVGLDLSGKNLSPDQSWISSGIGLV